MAYVPAMIAAGAASESAAAPGLVVEVEREVFLGLLKQPEKPLVLANHAGFPKTHRYFVRIGEYFFLYRTRQEEDLSALASVLPVQKFHTSPSSVE